MGTEQVIRGVTTFYSETGTEGGYWAVQDEKFMGIPNGDLYCADCGLVWSGEGEPPAPTFTYWVDATGQTTPEGYSIMSGMQAFGEPHPKLPLGPNGAVDAWAEKRNAISLKCYENGHATWKPMYPNGMWSYEGLHTLNTGDHLTVYEKDGVTIKWAGIIDLQQHPLFTEDASGMWIHADQRGQDREAWAELFLNEYPCELIPKNAQ